MASATKLRPSRVSAIHSHTGRPNYKTKAFLNAITYDKETKDSIFKEMENDATADQTFIQLKKNYEKISKGELTEMGEIKVKLNAGYMDRLWLTIHAPNCLLSKSMKEALFEQGRLDFIELTKQNLRSKRLVLESLENKYSNVINEISMVTSEYTRTAFDAKCDSLEAPSCLYRLPLIRRKLDILVMKQKDLELEIKIVSTAIVEGERAIFDFSHSKAFDPQSKALIAQVELMESLNIKQYELSKKLDKVKDVFADLNQDRIEEQAAFTTATSERAIPDFSSSRRGKNNISPTDLIIQRCDEQVNKMLFKGNKNVDIEIPIKGQYGYDDDDEYEDDDDDDPEADTGGLAILAAEPKGNKKNIVDTKNQFIQPIGNISLPLKKGTEVAL